jgi:hypothetical protein
MQDFICLVKVIHENSVQLAPGETLQCSKCKIRYGHDHVFTEAMLQRPCAYPDTRGKPCGGKWVKLLEKDLTN